MSTIFPKWTNHLPHIIAAGGLGLAVGVIGLVWYYWTPEFWEVGYQPIQPGTKLSYPGFSHEVHAGKLGMDCRYCHTHVEESPEANIPNVATCIGCHAEGRLNAQIETAGTFTRPNGATATKWDFIRTAYENDEPIAWRRVHKLPDYVRNFPHNVHVAAGVSCYSCHGMIAAMPIVRQVESLSMAWCLDCHRADRNEVLVNNLVPADKVTDLFWVEQQLAKGGNPAGDGTAGGHALLQELGESDLHLLPDNCGACHY